MRMRFTAVMVMALLSVPSNANVASAETIEASSQIVAVTVLPDRALVMRRTDLELPEGMHEVRLSSLPGTIEEGSVSAKGAGKAAVILFGARLVTTQLAMAQDPKIKAIEDEMFAVRRRHQRLLDTKQVLEQEQRYLNSIQAASSEQIGKDLITKSPNVSDISSLLAFLDETLLKNFERNDEADVELMKVVVQLDRLNRELSRLQGEARKQQTAIVVDLEAETAGRFTLDVSYRLPGATWQPGYEARATTGANHVRVVTSGLIRQRTGEDWTDVALTLSTARPAIGGRMPEIQPWWLRKMDVIADERATRGLESQLMGEPSDATKARSPEGAMEKIDRIREAELAQAVVEMQGPAVTFTLPKPETIPADWQLRKASVRVLELPASFAYETTPRLSPYAYLRAKATNSSELVFLPGEVQVFLDGAFVGNSSIDLIGPGEEFGLFLGTDERIRVERKQLKAKVDVSVLPGFHGRIKTVEYEYLTTIENFRPTPATITVIDQIPVSQHDEIKVEQVLFDPKPTDQDEEKPGVHRWTLILPAGGKQAIKLSYRVRHPVDFWVEGL